tara:strand:+ start:6834 stop:8918 length:2085 start_codon:yes stop_codon:yes gene_type:complete
MTLRRQLLLVSLLLLSLPWAGCQFIREMEGAMRYGQEQALQSTANAVAAVLGRQDDWAPQYPAGSALASGLPVHATHMPQALIIDGYADGWEDIPSVALASNNSDSHGVQYKAVTRDGYLYLFITVFDPDVVYLNPGLSPAANGDRLVLRMGHGQTAQSYVIASSAPGSVRASNLGRNRSGNDAQRIRGYWQDASDGYTLELEIPLFYTQGRLGFHSIDVDTPGEDAGERPAALPGTGTISAKDTVMPRLVYGSDALRETLSLFNTPGREITVVDHEHWNLAYTGSTGAARSGEKQTFWLLRLLYRSILKQDALAPPSDADTYGKIAAPEIDNALQGRTSSHRYRDQDYTTRTILSAAAPIFQKTLIKGAVVVRQSGEQYLSLTDQAFSRLLGYSLLALMTGILGLLGYASLLSWRIGKLNRDARNALASDPAARTAFTRSTAADEIGELSRSYADLLDQLQDYNDYLRTLSRKLSHELRTPIAVVQTSLENLKERDNGSGDTVYLSRAQDGLQRLNHILVAMSEASQLEESVRINALERLDLVPLLREVFGAYEGVYKQHSLQLHLGRTSAEVTAAPDLLIQALDKLMDNAASFSPAGETITLGLDHTAGGWLLWVENSNAVLPETLQEHLFEPMVSLRDSADGRVHLGLGLHIVRLIADYHKGSVSAANLPERHSVRITLALPSTPTPTTEQ